ncbi:NYN domain-containing protein [Cellulomonas cellasea]|uniref:NYN domain-containing protein n=1 Tax=Cellulomonas cellasea TaxID=43670 RepID=A0A4Y3KYT8_9CELL|nr:NYN domain-containing protein [Cellulomonas cellasea]GEA88536.1 NYN domain-containing protein [Cellulomonas cellasea]
MTTTSETTENGRRLRCALFVDFDNVYIGLQRLDPAAAEAFAAHPGDWLRALEQGSDIDGDFTRRFLVRACYLNPSVFSQFRPNFTRAGFSVVDCPSLTQQGKSSADINLVLDAVDALSAQTRYDEFVILSADADFTPLALRCRAADRRVTIVTAGPAASAYRAVADTVVTADELVELVTPPPAAELVAPATLAPVEGAPAPAAGGTTAEPPAAGAGRGGGRAPASPARKAVLRLVRAAERPLPGDVVAQAAWKADPALRGSGWDSTGDLFAWLARSVPELGTAPQPAPGFVWDPKRFSEADLQPVETVDLPPLQRQVVEVTDIPNLPTERYRVLLTALADDVRTTPFVRPETARRVRDACQAAGEAIGRASVNTVISGVLFAGLDLTTKPSAVELAQTWADNVVGLCRGARMELSPADVAAIRAWVGGGLVPR